MNCRNFSHTDNRAPQQIYHAIFTHDRHSRQTDRDNSIRSLQQLSVWQNPLHNHTLEVYSDIAKHDCIYILYSSYPRMYLSYPSNALITYKNTHFPDSDMPCLLHDSRSISSHLHDTALWLRLWQQPSTSLNIKMVLRDEHSVACINILGTWTISVNVLLPIKQRTAARDTKFDNVRVRSYPRIRTPNKPHAGLDRINLFW